MTPARKSTRRIAAVHDLSGVGRVSLMVVIPILSTMGFDVCPLPTAILSNHTQYPEYSFLDLTDEMPKMIAGWKKLEIEFDAIYTGYLGSPRQIQIVSGFIDDFRREDTLIVVDPVLGDNGRLYAGMTKEMVLEMRVLARRADVLTPNLTELFALLDRPYQHECSDELLKEALEHSAEHHHDDEDEDEDEHEHHHHDHDDHDDDCGCGCHDHHHHHHHADEVFTSWGVETAKKFEKATIEAALKGLDSGDYGMILRAKGILPCVDGTWIHFDYVPEEHDIRTGSADVTGKLCVIGSKLDENGIQQLFGV